MKLMVLFRITPTEVILRNIMDMLSQNGNWLRFQSVEYGILRSSRSAWEKWITFSRHLSQAFNSVMPDILGRVSERHLAYFPVEETVKHFTHLIERSRRQDGAIPIADN